MGSPHVISDLFSIKLSPVIKDYFLGKPKSDDHGCPYNFHDLISNDRGHNLRLHSLGKVIDSYEDVLPLLDSFWERA